MDVFKLMGRIAIDASDAESEIGRIVKSANNASRKITTAFGKIEKTFTGTAKGIQTMGRALNQVGQTTERVGRTIANGIAIGAGAVATAAVAIGKNALDIRSSIEQGLGGAEAVFKQYAYIVENNSKTAWKSAGLSMEEYLATANKMGSLFKGSGFSEADAALKTQDLIQRAADVASIMGISMDAAMESVAGMAKGNLTMMDNLGVAMNDTTLEAYRLEKGMAKSVSTMTTAEKVGLAYEMFMERTADYAGNYAKENETAAGSLQTLKAAWSNFLGGVGTFEDLEKSAFGYLNIAAKTMGLDSLEPFILGAQKTVEEVAEILSMDNLDGRQKIAKIRRLLLEKSISLTSGMGEKIVQGVSSASDIISETLSDINVNLPHYLEVGRSIFNSVRDGVREAAIPLANAAEVVSSEAISAWFTTKTDFITIGLNILGSIAQGITNDLAKGEDSTIAASVQDGVGNVLNAIFTNAPKGIKALGGVMVLVTNTIGAIAEGITEELNGENGDAFVSSITTAIVDILKAASQAIPSVLDAGKNIVTKLSEAISKDKDSISNGIADVVAAITSWLTDPANLVELGKAAGNIGLVIMDGMLKGSIYTVFGWVDSLFGTDFEARARAVQLKNLDYVSTGELNGEKVDPSDTEKINEYLEMTKQHDELVNSLEMDNLAKAKVDPKAIQNLLSVITQTASQAEKVEDLDASITAYTKEADAVSNTLVEQQSRLAEAERNYVASSRAHTLIYNRLEEGDLSSGFSAADTELLKGYFDDFEQYFNVGTDGKSDPKLNGQKMQKVFSRWVGDAQRGMSDSESEAAEASKAIAELKSKLSDLQTKIQEAQTAQEAANKGTETLGKNSSDAAGDVSGLGDAANTAADKLSNINPSFAPANVDGSHASGLDFVPKDNYIARLHRGETVLNKEAAKVWRMQQNSGYGNLEKTVAELANAVQELREGFNANMNLYVNKRHVASAMSRDMGRSIGNREYTLMKGMGG